MKKLVKIFKNVKEKIRNAPDYVVCYYMVDGKIKPVIYNTTRALVKDTMTRAMNESVDRRDSTWSFAAEYRSLDVALFRARHPSRAVLERAMQS